MSDPKVNPNTSGFPEASSLRHFRNTLLQFKKALQTSKDSTELHVQMEHFLNASRQVTWPHHTCDVYHKDEAEKAVDKVITEFQRYIKDLEHPTSLASSKDLMDALFVVESMLDRIKDKR
jgi:hypothetical protein